MKITKEPFGRFTEYVLTNPETGDTLYVVPEFGGIIRKMTLAKSGKLTHVIDCGDTPEALLSGMNAYPSTHLFPWGNRVRNGSYTFEGNHYQLPINEVALKNALHGIVCFSIFEVVVATADDIEAKLTLRYTYKGGHLGYPFAFIIDITHIFSADEGLVLTYSIQNIGETAMPMVLGWHPYFKIDGEKADDWQLELPATHQYISDSQMIPADKKAVNFEGLIQIKEHVLDNVFAVATSSKVTAILHSPTQDIALHIWQEALAGQFNFMVVYIPPARDCIAIEPMTGNTDAYNSGDGLLTLAVGACYEVSCGVFIA